MFWKTKCNRFKADSKGFGIMRNSPVIPDLCQQSTFTTHNRWYILFAFRMDSITHSIIRWHSFFIQTKYSHRQKETCTFLWFASTKIIHFCIHYFISLTLMYGGSLDGLRPFIFIHTNSKIIFAGLFIKRRRTKKQNSTQKWQEKNSY